MDSSPGKRNKKLKKSRARKSQKAFGEVPWPQSSSELAATSTLTDRSLQQLDDTEIEIVNLDSDDEAEEFGETSKAQSSKNSGKNKDATKGSDILSVFDSSDENEEDGNLFDSLEGDEDAGSDSNEENEEGVELNDSPQDENEGVNLFDSLEEVQYCSKNDDLSSESEDDDEESEDATEMEILSDSEGQEEENEEMNELIDSNEEDEELNGLSSSNDNEDSPLPTRDFDLDNLEVELDSDEVEPAPIPFMRNLQQGIFYRKMDSNSIFVSIVPGESLYFSGKCSIKVLKGVIEVYGCQLTSEEPKRILFSPKGHSSLLSISSLASESEIDRDLTTARNSSIPDMDGDAAMIILELFENEWCEGIRSYCTDGESLIGAAATGIGPGKLPKLNEFSNKLGFQLISPSQYDKSRLFSTSPMWDEVLYTLQCDDSLPRIAIFGGKGVGKSTFFRWTVNKCLSLYGQSVMAIDLDPGQTEFSPPGLISAYICQEPLLGPNFTHLVQPLRAIFIGSINVSDCPTTYKNALQSLYEFLTENEEYLKIPWIINTMGFSMGLGVHLACEVIQTFLPSAVIQITIENPKRSFPFQLTNKSVIDYQRKNSLGKSPRSQIRPVKEYQFFAIESVCNARNERNQNPWGGRPKDLRENVIASYFAELIGSTTDCNFLSIVPYQVKLDDTAIGTMNSNLSYENILRAINGNLVALCEFPESSFSLYSAGPGNSSQSNRSNRKYIVNGSSVMNSCVGYGVVRAMDLPNGLLFIVTPVAPEILAEKVNTIISAGAIGLPIQFYVNGADESEELPYVSLKGSSKTKLDSAAKKHFNYRRSIPKIVKNSLR